MSVLGPISTVVDKAMAGVSTTIFFIGDSTVWGACDGGNTLVSNGGWPKRLGAAIGQYCDTTVKYRVYSTSTQTYSADVTAYTGSGAHQITIINGGVSSQYIASLTNYINSAGLITADAELADCVFIGTGINDAYYGATPTTYVPNYLTFIDLIRSHCTSAIFCSTTQNVLSSTAMSGNYSRYTDNYNALFTELVGDTLPTDPVLQYSDMHNIWALDTQQAYDSIYQVSLMADNVHPNAAGYTAQASWMFSALSVPAEVPFASTNTARLIYRVNGYSHEVALKQKTNGSFHPVAMRT